MIRRICTIAVAAILVAACSTPETLEPHSAVPPAGTDLSGNWRMREVSPIERRRLREAIDKTDSVSPSRRQRQRSPQGRSRGGQVHVFLETGTSLKVTQTEHALFISFDRSVVEEFRFGEKRMVNVGQVEAQRVTGWVGSELVVETLDKNGMKLTERYSLIDNGKTLERRIIFRSKNLDEETLVQMFDPA